MKILYLFIILITLSGMFIWGLKQYDFANPSKDQVIKIGKEKTESEVSYPHIQKPDELEAYNLAADLVQKFLQEPATAEFPKTEEKLKHTEYLEGEYRINSWVDSQDTYGAITRRNFSCIIATENSDLVVEEFILEEFGEIIR